MATSDVIAAVSATLEARVTAAMSTIGPPVPLVELHDLVDLPPSDPPTVTLFLYQIVEDPTTRNRPKTTRIVNGVARTLKQPLGLCLQYMITAWAGAATPSNGCSGAYCRCSTTTPCWTASSWPACSRARQTPRPKSAL